MKSLKRVRTFHKKKKNIPKIILSRTGNKEVIYGARALNKRFPPFLDTTTKDYDIFSPTPKKDARETEKALDKHFGGDFFYIKQAEHPGTWKVKSKINEEGYADYTIPESKIPSDKLGKNRYAKLDWIKAKINKSLKDPEAEFRHAKDRDALNRIRIYEKLKGIRKKRVEPIVKVNKEINKVMRLKLL